MNLNNNLFKKYTFERYNVDKKIYEHINNRPDAIKYLKHRYSITEFRKLRQKYSEIDLMEKQGFKLIKINDQNNKKTLDDIITYYIPDDYFIYDLDTDSYLKINNKYVTNKNKGPLLSWLQRNVLALSYGVPCDFSRNQITSKRFKVIRSINIVEKGQHTHYAINYNK